MGISQELTERIRGLVALDPRITEQKMFGGIAFLLDGRILVSARRTGSLLVQCGAVAADEAVKTPGISHMVMGGRSSANFIDVADDSLETEEGLQAWIDLAEKYVTGLPPK